MSNAEGGGGACQNNQNKKRGREKVLLGKQKERDGTFRQVKAKGCTQEIC